MLCFCGCIQRRLRKQTECIFVGDAFHCNMVDLTFLFLVLWRYRLNVEKAEWIIYVTDVGQQQHFEMFFNVST